MIPPDEPVIEEIPSKVLAGIHLSMSLENNRTHELWQRFIPLISGISGRKNMHELISLQVYTSCIVSEMFEANRQFEKWACVEVNENSDIPEGMDSMILPGGTYAVFPYRGKPEDGESIFRYIFTGWLPQSGYLPDARPHFEILGPAYKNGDPDSEETICIPVRRKNKEQAD